MVDTAIPCAGRKTQIAAHSVHLIRLHENPLIAFSGSWLGMHMPQLTFFCKESGAGKCDRSKARGGRSTTAYRKSAGKPMKKDYKQPERCERPETLEAGSQDLPIPRRWRHDATSESKQERMR